MGFHFDEEGISIYYGFSAADVFDLPAGRPGVIGVATDTGACFCYVTAAGDTKRMLHDLLKGNRVIGLHQYLAEHGGPHFMVEETPEGEDRARQLIELYKPIFNVVQTLQAGGRVRYPAAVERPLMRSKERVH